MAQIQSTEEFQNKMVTRAQALLNAVAKREYLNAIVHFDTAMTSSMPAAKLEELWTSIQEKVGPFVEQVSARLAGVEATPIVTLLCKFARTNLDIYVAFDAAANISGLNIGPEPAQTTASKLPDAAIPPTNEPPAHTEFST